MRTICTPSLLRWQVGAIVLAAGSVALGQASSPPPILQLFESSYSTVENRAADIFMAGYGTVYLPPPGRAEQGNSSVGYDPYDRFDLGKPGNPTLYGTETGIKSAFNVLHRAGKSTYLDLVWNHNGYSTSATQNFVASGSYPGLSVQLPNDQDGDFHSAFATGDIETRLAGLIDIAQEKNYQFIRSPVDANDTRNIPAGTLSSFGRLANIPTADNKRFYPDQQGTSRSLYDPATGESNVVRYDFNAANPMTGDAVPENALGYLMRNAQWLVQVVGADGFRLDAPKHFPTWVLNYLDRSVYQANPRKLLDGSINNVFSFSEVFDTNMSYLQGFVRKDINASQPGTIGGNRDVLDFPLHYALKQNLSSNGTQNDWNALINASFDINDGNGQNGSQGVSFDASHDDPGADLGNVANAYMLLRPGNAIVYMNNREFGVDRDFPKAGRGDALGGSYGDTITKLVDIRNTHGRGDVIFRDIEKETLIFERNQSMLIAMSNRSDGGYDARTVQTSFPAGTPLVELTGNAADPAVDPFNDFPEVLVVKANGMVDLRVARNVAPGTNGAFTGKGYLVYGLATPQGTLSMSNVVQTLAGGTADLTGIDQTTAAGKYQAARAIAQKRTTAIDVVKTDSFTLTLNTTAVNLLGSIRDKPADGDNAVFMVNGGLDLNGSGAIDFTTPGSVVYGFEQFTGTRQPGWTSTSGAGTYSQSIDVTKLPEGQNFVTVRAFRHRDDNGPAVFTDFRKVIYVDRLKPVSAVASFDPYDTANTSNRDLVIKSVDQTADHVNVFLNLPATATDANVLSYVGGGNLAGTYDRDLFKYGFQNVQSGNNVVTVVTYEITGTYNIQRLTGVSITNGRGKGLGDLNADEVYSTADIAGGGAMEQYVYSQNAQFNPAGDLNADGKVDNKDLFALPALYAQKGATVAVRTEARNAVLRRGNINHEFGTDSYDIDRLFKKIGTTDDLWYDDLDTDGTVTKSDVDTLVRTVFQSDYGDANLDGRVDSVDFATLVAGYGGTNKFWVNGDFNGDNKVDTLDFASLVVKYGFSGLGPNGLPTAADLPEGFGPGAVVPEPASALLLAASLLMLPGRRSASLSRGRRQG